METKIPKCKIKGCKNRSDIRYYGKLLCLKCFDKYETEELKFILKIKEEINEDVWEED